MRRYLRTALNLLRTHYTPSQRAMFAAERADLSRGEVGKGRPLDVEKSTSIQRAADEVGVERSSVSVAKRLIREAVPEVTSKVKEGKLTLHAASQIAQLPKPDQPAAVEKVIAASKGKARHTPTAAGCAPPAAAGASLLVGLVKSADAVTMRP